MDTTKREAKVRAAVEALNVALAQLDAAQRSGADEQTMRARWDAVEVAGATIHRQSRILSGKPRGG